MGICFWKCGEAIFLAVKLSGEVMSILEHSSIQTGYI
jgi:hypothetical protein